jgi:hypothetical protein
MMVKESEKEEGEREEGEGKAGEKEALFLAFSPSFLPPSTPF